MSKLFKINFALILLLLFCTCVSIAQVDLQHVFEGQLTNGKLGDELVLSRDGNRIAISQLVEVDDGYYPEILIYDRVGNEWVLFSSVLEANESAENFNVQLAFAEDSNRLIVGVSPERNDNHVGFVKVYNLIDNKFLQIGETMFGDEANDGFGFAIDIDSMGTRIIIGSPFSTNDGLDNVGKVDVFELVGDEWLKYGNTLTGTHEDEGFGFSVSILPNGTQIVVGAPGFSLFGPSQCPEGGIYAYSLINEGIIEKGDGIIYLGGGTNCGHGYFVKMIDEGNRIVSANSGGFGGSKVDQIDYTGTVWEGQQFQQLRVTHKGGPGVGTFFGHAIGINREENLMLIGASRMDRTGKAYLAKKGAERWEILDFLFKGVETDDSYGSSVSLSADGRTFAISSPNRNLNDMDNGEVLIYTFDLTTHTNSINEIDDNVLLFPNPTNGEFYISKELQNITRNDVLNGIGQICSTFSATDKLDVAQLPNGFYHVAIYTAESRYLSTLVKY